MFTLYVTLVTIKIDNNTGARSLHQKIVIPLKCSWCAVMGVALIADCQDVTTNCS